jgi:hypothetical protein
MTPAEVNYGFEVLPTHSDSDLSLIFHSFPRGWRCPLAFVEVESNAKGATSDDEIIGVKLWDLFSTHIHPPLLKLSFHDVAE